MKRTTTYMEQRAVAPLLDRAGAREVFLASVAKQPLLCIAAAALVAMLAGCADVDDPSGVPDTSYRVANKYDNGEAECRDTNQANWHTANCHDPKLFKDGGMYYVYATDAACGGSEKVGFNIRKSSDLIHWTTLPDSALQGYWDPDFIAWEGFSASTNKDTKQTNSGGYNAGTWAPTVLKHPTTGLYYMYHGVNADLPASAGVASAITLTIACRPEGPFYPADFVSGFEVTDSTDGRYMKKYADLQKTYTGNDPAHPVVLDGTSGKEWIFKPGARYDFNNPKKKTDKIPARDRADILAIKAVLVRFNITYKQNFLVRYAQAPGPNKTAKPAAKIKGTIDGADYYLGGVDVTNAVQYDVASPAYGYTKNDCYGCIDPEFVFDFDVSGDVPTDGGKAGCYAMTYGSWKQGIPLIYVDMMTLKPMSGSTVLDKPLDNKTTGAGDTSDTILGVPLIGDTAGTVGGQVTAYEGAQLFKYHGKYFMVTSVGQLDWDYRTGVFRADTITGTYEDCKATPAPGKVPKSDNAKYHAYGAKIIGAYQFGNHWSDNYGFRGQGGLSVATNPAGDGLVFACHARTNFLPGYCFFLQCFDMKFVGADGSSGTGNGGGPWPLLNMTEYDGQGSSGEGLTLADIAGTYDVICTETSRTAKVYNGPFDWVDGNSGALKKPNGDDINANQTDGEPTHSKIMTINADGTITGAYTGTVSLDSGGRAQIFVRPAAASGTWTAENTFSGFFMRGTDYTRHGGAKRTITFNSVDTGHEANTGNVDDLANGQYFFGNKR